MIYKFITHLSRLTKYPFPVVGPRDDDVGGNDAVSTCGVKGTLDLNISGPSLLVYSTTFCIIFTRYWSSGAQNVGHDLKPKCNVVTAKQ